MQEQVQVVSRALDCLAAGQQVPTVAGVLCFVDADWPLLGGSFMINEVQVEWPRKTYHRLTRPGDLDASEVRNWHRVLAEAFPRA
jgi:hypothetical protein